MDHIYRLQRVSESRGIEAGVPQKASALGESNRSYAVLWGAFRLFARQRLLLEDDRPVNIGSRALDILIALITRPGELVTKRELMSIVWPDTVVVEANLTVNVVALRRALRDGQNGNRYILNIPGRGYSFVAPVEFTDEIKSPELLTGLRAADAVAIHC
jgi:DNA-binding winged helix-turn-helix (wHTH) protein